MDPFATPGAFSWCELTTPHPEAALAFYRGLLGWTTDTMDVGTGPYHVVKAGDSAVGGVMAATPGMPAAWSCYVTVADCDAVADRCLQLGGEVLVGPMDVPTVGRMAVLKDPQGAAFSVMAYTPR